jgi:hypothetical protein
MVNQKNNNLQNVPVDKPHTRLFAAVPNSEFWGTEDDDEDDSWYLRSSSNLWGNRLVFVNFRGGKIPVCVVCDILR